MNKRWYVVRKTKTNFHSTGTVERVVDGLNKKQADRLCKGLSKDNEAATICYWVDFEWG